MAEKNGIPVQPESSTPLKKAVKTTGLLPLSDARIADLQEQVSTLKKEVTKHHDEQKQIIIGVVVATSIAVLLVVAGVVVQLLIFDSSYKDGLSKQQDDNVANYKELQKSVQDAKDIFQQQILDLDKQIMSSQTTQ